MYLEEQEEETSITRVNGTKGFVLQVKKQDQADIIRTVKRIRGTGFRITSELPQTILDIFYTDDSSEAVSNRLEYNY